MAIFWGEKEENTNRLKVISICYTMNDPIDEEWHQIDKIPDPPESRTGEIPVMYYDLVTKEFTFDYIPRPLTPEEEKDKQIKELQDLLNHATDLLVEGGML
ncbi:hypothetical protein D1872_50430 [compost metagenome]